jgi:hypothetical protein
VSRDSHFFLASSGWLLALILSPSVMLSVFVGFDLLNWGAAMLRPYSFSSRLGV